MTIRMSLQKILLKAMLFGAIFLPHFIYAESLHAESLKIKDVLGREVEVKMPLKRIVLGFYYTDFLAIGTKNAFDNVVGFVKDAWAVYMPPSYEIYSKIIPRLKILEDVGDPQFGTFSIEKLLSLNPDLVILADWQYEILSNEMALLDKMKIPVVVISYNKEQLEEHLLSTQILGEILQQQDRAKKISEFYKTRYYLVQEKIAKANLPKPRIYIEFGNKGPSELSFTYGKDMWGSLIDLAGGENIAAPFVEKWAVINNEQIIASKPEVIIITGRETEISKNTKSMAMGINIDESEAKRRLDGFKKRQGWESLPAVKNNRFYALYHRASTTMVDIASLEFIAKALYPSLFGDINPLQTYIDFHKEFMPLVPNGAFMLE